MDKPRCKLIGENGNIFNLISIAAKALEKEGLKDEADEMIARIYKSQSYTDALGIIMEYVEAE